MTAYHTCVWIDHVQAKVFAIHPDTASGEVVQASGPHRHLHRKADHVHQGKAKPDDAFMAKIADEISEAEAILIAGPGTAKDEFAHFLKQHRSPIAARIWAVEAMDHPTDPEIIAAARRFFHSADRMHG